MPDLRERFETAEDVPAPDLWPAVEARLSAQPLRERSLPMPRSPRRELVAVAVVLALVTGAIAVIVSRSEGSRPVTRPVHPGPAGVFAPYVGWIAVGGQDGLWMVDPAQPDRRSSLRPASPGFITVFGWDEGGSRLLFGSSFSVPASCRGLPSCTNTDSYDVQVWGPGGRVRSVWRVPARGTSQSVGGAAISPDGSRVVVALDNLTDGELWQVDVAGSQRRLLRQTVPGTHDGGGFGAVAFSPDGQRIAFERFAPGGSGVWEMDADGSDAHRLALSGGGGLAWAPDGRSLAFIDTSGNLAVADLGGIGPRPVALVSSAPAWTQATAYVSPTWSPDGSTIAFLAGAVLCTAHTDGSDFTTLPVTTPAKGASIAWNPG